MVGILKGESGLLGSERDDDFEGDDDDLDGVEDSFFFLGEDDDDLGDGEEEGGESGEEGGTLILSFSLKTLTRELSGRESGFTGTWTPFSHSSFQVSEMRRYSS